MEDQSFQLFKIRYERGSITGKPVQIGKDFPNMPRAFEWMAENMNVVFGTTYAVECYRYEGEERKERQFRLSID